MVVMVMVVSMMVSVMVPMMVMVVVVMPVVSMMVSVIVYHIPSKKDWLLSKKNNRELTSAGGRERIGLAVRHR